MNQLWQEIKGKPFWRFQTDDKEIIKKLLKDDKFDLTTSGDISIFCCQFERPDIAKGVFKAITGVKPEIDKEGIYFTNQ